MKHIFIMNPAAGKGKAGEVFLPKIIETAKKMGIDYEIHRTIAPGDACHFVKSRCMAMADKPGSGIIRFYACGGDGTLSEVVNGAYGFDDVEVAMVPAGTGNDFPRNFSNFKYFEDIDRQIEGTAKPVDIIRYKATVPDMDSGSLAHELDALFNSESQSTTRYCINMFNIGLDCNVAEKVAKIKKYPFMPGALAYGVGVGVVLMEKKGIDFEILLDDGEVHRGGFLLVAIGNGCYCGGGFKGVPRASVDDGFIDVSIVENVSRRTFLSLIGKYRKGTHLEDPAVSRIVTYRKCRSLTIKPMNTVKLCTDGDVSTVGETFFEIVPGGINFSVPWGCV